MTAVVVTLILCLTLLASICAIAYAVYRLDNAAGQQEVRQLRDEVAATNARYDALRGEWQSWKEAK